MTDDMMDKESRPDPAQQPNFDEFRSLGMSFDLSPAGLREVLQEKGHTNDLTRSRTLLKELYSKIAKGIQSGDITASDAREFAEVYRDFASQIDPDSSKRASQTQRAINHLANAIENRITEPEAVEEQLQTVEKRILSRPPGYEKPTEYPVFEVARVHSGKGTFAPNYAERFRFSTEEGMRSYLEQQRREGFRGDVEMTRWDRKNEAGTESGKILEDEVPEPAKV